jgi:hypothetical protein
MSRERKLIIEIIKIFSKLTVLDLERVRLFLKSKTKITLFYI